MSESIALKGGGGLALAATPAFYEQTWWLSFVAVAGLFVLMSAMPEALKRYRRAYGEFKEWLSERRKG